MTVRPNVKRWSHLKNRVTNSADLCDFACLRWVNDKMDIRWRFPAVVLSNSPRPFEIGDLDLKVFGYSTGALNKHSQAIPRLNVAVNDFAGVKMQNSRHNALRQSKDLLR